MRMAGLKLLDMQPSALQTLTETEKPTSVHDPIKEFHAGYPKVLYLVLRLLSFLCQMPMATIKFSIIQPSGLPISMGMAKTNCVHVLKMASNASSGRTIIGVLPSNWVTCPMNFTGMPQSIILQSEPQISMEMGRSTFADAGKMDSPAGFLRVTALYQALQ